MIRRLKKDVLDQLPDKRRQMIKIDVEKKYIKDINKAMAAQGGMGGSDTMNDLASMMQKVVGYKPSEP